MAVAAQLPPAPRWFLSSVNKTEICFSEPVNPEIVVTDRPFFRFSIRTASLCFSGGTSGTCSTNGAHWQILISRLHRSQRTGRSSEVPSKRPTLIHSDDFSGWTALSVDTATWHAHPICRLRYARRRCNAVWLAEIVGGGSPSATWLIGRSASVHGCRCGSGGCRQCCLWQCRLRK